MNKDDEFDRELDDDSEEEAEEGGEGWAGADSERNTNKPSLLCFLVDASKLMVEPHDFSPAEREMHRAEGGLRRDVKSFYGLAMSVICKACREQVKKGLKDQVGVVLFNCDEQGSKESGVYTLQGIQELSCPFISTLETQGQEGTCTGYKEDADLNPVSLKASSGVFSPKDVSTSSCNLFRALKQAQEMFALVPGKSKEMKKTICILTCTDDPIGGPVKSNERLERKKALLSRCNDIKSFNIHIDVYPLQDEVSMDGFPSGTDGSAPPISRDIFRSGIVFKHMVALAEAPYDSEVAKALTEKCLEGNDNLACEGEGADKKKGFKEDMKKLLEKVEDILRNRHVVELQDEIEARMLAMRSVGSIRWILQWGEENMRIGLKVYSLTSTSHTRKTQTVTAQKRQKVKMVREKTDEEGNVLDNRDAKYFKKFLESYAGKDKVILDPSQGDTYSVRIEKGIKLLGFQKKDQVIRPELNLKASQVMLPAEDDVKGSTVAFAALWQAMLSQGLVAVCVAKLRAVGEPRLVALLPQKKDVDGREICTAPDCFYVVTLPYRDDIRSTPKAILPVTAPPPNAVEEAKKVMNKMRLKDTPHPSDFPNPDHARYIATLEALSLKTVINEEEIEAVDKKLETPAARDHIHSSVEGWKAEVDQEYDDHLEQPPAGASKKRSRDDNEEKPPKEAKQPKKVVDADQVAKFETFEDVLRAKVDTLKDFCRFHDLRVSGTKDALQQRVKKHLFGDGDA